LESILTQLKANNYAGAWEIADVTDRSALHAAAASFTRRLGPIEVLIASAGIGNAALATDFRAEDLERQVRVNLVGVANSIEVVLPGMLERGRGRLVAISSAASYRGLPFIASYCASKAGVNALMDSLRVELRPRGIDCTTICPGWVRTPLAERSLALAGELLGRDSLPGLRMLAVEDAARRIVRAIVKRKALYTFPASTRWLGPLLSCPPARISDWLVRVLVRLAAKK
jgi:short-subunit dehydrogenase